MELLHALVLRGGVLQLGLGDADSRLRLLDGGLQVTALDAGENLPARHALPLLDRDVLHATHQLGSGRGAPESSQGAGGGATGAARLSLRGGQLDGERPGVLSRSGGELT